MIDQPTNLEVEVKPTQDLSMEDFEQNKLQSIEKEVNRDSNKSRFQFALILSSNSIGISSLAYPSAMATTGIINFTILMVIAIIINYTSGYLLVYCAKVKKAKNYATLNKIMLGRFNYIVDIAFLFTNLGILVSCILTFNDFMSGMFFKHYFQQSSEFLKRKESLFWIVFPNLILIPILVRKNLKDISIFSAITVFACFLFSIFCIKLFFEKYNDLDTKHFIYCSRESILKNFILLLFGYTNQQNLIDIFFELKRKKMGTFNHILKIQYFLLTFIYFSVALFGYLSFADKTDIKDQNIFAFDLPTNYFTIFTKISVILSILLSLIVTFKPTKDMIIFYLHKNHEEQVSNNLNIKVSISMQILLIILCCYLVINDINFIDVVEFISLTIAPLICIYLPIYFYIKITQKYILYFVLILMILINMYAFSQL